MTKYLVYGSKGGKGAGKKLSSHMTLKNAKLASEAFKARGYKGALYKKVKKTSRRPYGLKPLYISY